MSSMKDMEKALAALDDHFSDLDDEYESLFKNILRATGCSSVSELKADKMMKPTIKREELTTWLEDSFDVMVRARQALFLAEETMKSLLDQTINDKFSIISLQNIVIEKQDQNLQEMSSTVQDEMRGQCDIAKKSCRKSDSYVAKEHIKTRLKSVSKEEDRSKNLIVFGLHEEKEEDLESKVSGVLECLGDKPKLLNCVRMTKGDKKDSARPVKVTLSSSGTVHRILQQSGSIRNMERYKGVLIAPDRSSEERFQKLVEMMKEFIKTDPSKYYYMKRKLLAGEET